MRTGTHTQQEENLISIFRLGPGILPRKGGCGRIENMSKIKKMVCLAKEILNCFGDLDCEKLRFSEKRDNTFNHRSDGCEEHCGGYS